MQPKCVPQLLMEMTDIGYLKRFRDAIQVPFPFRRIVGLSMLLLFSSKTPGKVGKSKAFFQHFDGSVLLILYKPFPESILTNSLRKSVGHVLVSKI